MNTSNLNIPLVQTAQAQKEVTVNEALTRIDAILNSGAISRNQTTPPGSPNEGDLYILPTGAAGEWIGHDREIAYFHQIWRFIEPKEGMSLWVNDEDVIYSYNGFDWTPAGGGVGRQTIYVPATQIIPSAAAGAAPLVTTAIGADQPDIHYIAFDASVDESAQFSLTMPRRWNQGGGQLVFEWSHAASAAAADVSWAVQALSFGIGDGLNASFATADTIIGTGGTGDTIYRATTGFISIFNGPADTDTLYFKLTRQASLVVDTLASDARLHSVSFQYFSDATTDD